MMLVLPCGDAIDRVQFIERSGWTGDKSDAMNVVATGDVATGYSGGPIGLGTTLFGESRLAHPAALVDCIAKELIMITALVLINVQRGEVNETAQQLLEIAGVAEVYSVTGEYDLIALLRFPDYEDLANVVTRQMQQISSITKTHTLMAFKCFSRADLQQAWDIGVE